MTPNRAYLLRALNEWILDNQCTPYVVVNTAIASVEVPEAYVKDGQIVLNINPAAVRHLALTNDSLSFEARFAGQSQAVFVPIEAITAIYAKENGAGMVFSGEVEPSGPGVTPEPPTGPEPPAGPSSTSKKSNKPQLKVIK